jgi:peptide deformylase
MVQLTISGKTPLMEVSLFLIRSGPVHTSLNGRLALFLERIDFLTILPIVMFPEKILKQKCVKVTSFDKNLAKLLNNMYETMVEADGVGLAAPQVGVKKQVAVVEVDEESGVVEMINPEILETSEEQTGVEGCLSIPDVYGEVTRSYRIKIRAQNRRGENYELEAEDFLARAIQHEIDHLQGILFISKISRYLTTEELEGYEAE